MAKSTGIVLTATGISFANDWLQTNQPNWRIPVAGLVVALIFDGVEHVNETAGVGLSVLMMIAVLLTPIHGKSPADTIISLTKGK
jgi:hypothetical protein